MVKRQDHICSGRTCMFCRVLDMNQKDSLSGQRAYMDQQVLDRVKELEEKAKLTSKSSPLDVEAEDISRLALVDTLTDFYNVRTFIKELRDEVKRSVRYKRPAALCMFSIDGFRNIMRDSGANAADNVTKALADIVRDAIRDVDIPARYTHEDLIVLFPETSGQGAAVVADRIRQRVANQTFTVTGSKLKVTASIGIAAYPANAKGPEELLQRTEQALETAIEHGGNQVCTI